MPKSAALLIGLRYALARSRSQLVSFISMISMLGMMFGVALLIVVLSIMNGFEREMQQRILGLVPHITVSALKYSDPFDWQAIEKTVADHPGVVGSAPFIKLNAMLMRGNSVDGVVVFGIDPDREAKVSIAEQFLPTGSLQQLAVQQDGIILGAGLASKLAIKAGDKINLMITMDGPGASLAAGLKTRFQRFTVLTLLSSGTEIDQSLAFIHQHKAQKLVANNRIEQGLRLRIADTFQAQKIAWQLERDLPYGLLATDWTRTHGNLYAAIQLSRQLVGLMLLTIIAVAAFNVISALVMVVTDKRGDIAILRTLGASPRMILSVFMIQGTVIGLIGALAGAAMGVGLSLSATELVAALESALGFQFLNTDVYPVDYVPADLRWSDVVLVCSVGFAMTVLATVYPSLRAARVQPAEALRYD
jgi:lipoprotein-releasing system permease protein